MLPCFRVTPRAVKSTLFCRLMTSITFRSVMESSTQGPASKGDQGQSDRKRTFQGGRNPKIHRKRKEKPIEEGSTQAVLLADIRDLFAAQSLSDSSTATTHELSKILGQPENYQDHSAKNGDLPAVKDSKDQQLPTPFTEIEVEVVELSSTGDGLARHPSSDQIYVVPFSVPGDRVKVKVVRHVEKDHYSLADFISVVKASPLRDDNRIKCKYFSICSGCQFQMLDYGTQLEHKQNIVQKAYKSFSKLPSELVPAIQNTFGSPLRYEYRTKLTPHFDGPPGRVSKADLNKGVKKNFTEVPNIGFMQKGKRETLDIEDCPIGTDAVRMGMKRERARVAREIKRYHKGATILLRESTTRVAKDDEKASESLSDTIKIVTPTHMDLKTCITDNNAESTEYIDDFVFTNIAGSFFQNNNSILPKFTKYIRDNIMPPKSKLNSKQPDIKYLIDAYCGSGLFTITLSSLFTASIGIDVSTTSIASARRNAVLNKLPSSQCTFIEADAAELFKSVRFSNDETAVVLDPSRKGCDDSFLQQLLKFAPRRVVYVSCNVHTQARDVGKLVQGMDDGGTRYSIESIRGFDFFPQTGHVEGVAVLNRVEIDVKDSEGDVESQDAKYRFSDEQRQASKRRLSGDEGPEYENADPVIKRPRQGMNNIELPGSENQPSEEEQ
jgi:tRNA (uracil-5-)-methyltransferase